eukprot:740342-Prorocentrum_minimum.AAC.1
MPPLCRPSHPHLHAPRIPRCGRPPPPRLSSIRTVEISSLNQWYNGAARDSRRFPRRLLTCTRPMRRRVAKGSATDAHFHRLEVPSRGIYLPVPGVATRAEHRFHRLEVPSKGRYLPAG